MKRFGFILLGWWTTLITARLFAQEVTITGDIHTSGYPEIRLQVNTRNPELQPPETFRILEQGVTRPLRVEPLPVPAATENKVVLFLFEDMLKYHGNQRKDFKKLLKTALPRFAQPGDLYNIAFFDRNRDGSSPLRFALEEYTSDSGELTGIIDRYNPKPDRFNQQKSSELYHAIYDAITHLKEKFPGQNKVLVVLSAGKNLDLSNYSSLSDLTAYARQNHIPVYSLQYMVYEHENIDALAKGSYGKAFHIRGTYPLKGAHDIKTAADSLVAWMKGASSRIKGRDYLLTYRTGYPRDGKVHGAVLQAGDYSREFQFATPKAGFIATLRENRKTAIAAGTAVLALLLAAFWWLRRKRIRKRLREAQIQRQLEEQKKRLREQEEKARRIEEEARKAKEKIEREKQLRMQEAQEKKYRHILQQMQGPRGFPVLRLVQKDGYRDIPVNRPIFRVGKKDGNHLRISDPTVSGFHFKIIFDNGKFYIEDLQSTNGTWVNGRKIDRTELHHNDTIRAGKSSMVFIR